MRKVLRTAAATGCVLGALIAAAAIVEASDRPSYTAEQLGYDGCGAGFWKNHPVAWTQAFTFRFSSFESAFDVDYPGADTTLIDALQAGGAAYDALGRQAVAALLNARSTEVDYPIYSADVLAKVKSAVESGDPGPATAELEQANQLGCPTRGT
jgi:hypothetical protein